MALTVRGRDTASALSSFALKSFATAQNAEGLAQAVARVDERIRSRRVELKHLVMARNDQLGADVVRQLCGFRSGQIARHASFWSPAVNGKKRDIDGERAHLLRHSVVSQRVATVVEAPIAESQNVAQSFHASVLVTLNGLVRRCDCRSEERRVGKER